MKRNIARPKMPRVFRPEVLKQQLYTKCGGEIIAVAGDGVASFACRHCKTRWEWNQLGLKLQPPPDWRDFDLEPGA